jgi:cellulose synthase/poly-beta-1,6-N-acetylglucosamine synthase-like glycosyltransferase
MSTETTTPASTDQPGLVSVVMPVGGVDAPLEEQLRSLMAQDFEGDVEFILSLNTADPAQRTRLDDLVASLKDPRFRVVPSSDVRGAAHARNVGSAAANGTVLVYCDSDDRAHPAWLRLMVDALQHDDAVGGMLIGFGLSERQIASRPSPTPDQLPHFMGVPYIVSASMAVKRSAFDTTDGWDERPGVSEDIAISWQLLSKGFTLGFAPDACIDYRYRPGTIEMLKQGYQYGRRMSRVLMFYGVPAGDQWKRPSGASLLKPNGQKSGRPSLLKTVRRGSLAAGRIGGIVETKISQRRGKP